MSAFEIGTGLDLVGRDITAQMRASGRRLDRRRMGPDVHRFVQQIKAGYIVHDCMVHLPKDQRASGQAFKQRQAPQWTAAIEQTTGEINPPCIWLTADS